MNPNRQKNGQMLNSAVQVKFSPLSTRYGSLSRRSTFHPNQSYQSFYHTSQKYGRNLQSACPSYQRSQSVKQTNGPKLFSKYQILHGCKNLHKNEKKIKKEAQEQIKWVGIRPTNEHEYLKGYSSNNLFPQRKIKTNHQMVINLLMKYQRNFGYGRAQTEQDKQYNSPSNPQKIQKYMKNKKVKFRERTKWAKRTKTEYQTLVD